MELRPSAATTRRRPVRPALGQLEAHLRASGSTDVTPEVGSQRRRGAALSGVQEPAEAGIGDVGAEVWQAQLARLEQDLRRAQQPAAVVDDADPQKGRAMRRTGCQTPRFSGIQRWAAAGRWCAYRPPRRPDRRRGGEDDLEARWLSARAAARPAGPAPTTAICCLSFAVLSCAPCCLPHFAGCRDRSARCYALPYTHSRRRKGACHIKSLTTKSIAIRNA